MAQLTMPPLTMAQLTMARLATVARAASSVADTGSLTVTLQVLADAVRSTAAVAAAQVITLHGDGRLEVAGTSGFADVSRRFTEQLTECRRLGADLVMLRVLRTRRPAVVLHRKALVMADPRWAPIHDLLASADWDSFGCVPLVVRDEPVGVLTAFYPPGADPTARDLDFLTAMADQAAMAVDHAALLATSREEVRRRERERIARDLHDCVVQQVFALRLHARALAGQAESPTELPAELPAVDPHRVRRTADEICALATTALADLRDLIFQLRPAPLTEHGLVEAIRLHAQAVADRTGLSVRVSGPGEPLHLHPDQEDDLYRIVQEALHNVVKHAEASRVEVRLDTAPVDGRLLLEIRDDGRGPGRPGSARAGRTDLIPDLAPNDGDGGLGRGLGLVSMRERAQRWGGSLQLLAGEDGGARVVAAVPRPAPAPAPAPTLALALATGSRGAA
jgi:signal transduction histidine kinase